MKRYVIITATICALAFVSSYATPKTTIKAESTAKDNSGFYSEIMKNRGDSHDFSATELDRTSENSGGDNYLYDSYSVHSQPIHIKPGKKCEPPAPLPEPTTMLLFGAGLIGTSLAARKRRKNMKS